MKNPVETVSKLVKLKEFFVQNTAPKPADMTTQEWQREKDHCAEVIDEIINEILEI